MISNWPWAWPCWNCTTSYKFSVSFKKMGEGWTGGASDIVKAECSGEDPQATGGLVSNLPQPRVNKTKQHTLAIVGTIFGRPPSCAHMNLNDSEGSKWKISKSWMVNVQRTWRSRTNTGMQNSFSMAIYPSIFFFFGFWFVMLHTARDSITSETHTSGAQ